MSRIILIDSDFVLYRVCPNRVLSETEIMYGVKSEKTLQETLDLIDWYLVEKIFKPTQADSYIGFLGGIGNFRYSVDASYKFGRTLDRPPFFTEAKNHLIDKWGFIMVNGIEAEDAVGVCLTKYPEGIIVRTDHDLNQLEGTHYNPVTNSWETISKEQSTYNFNLSLLSGCSTDKVRGLKKGVGIKTAEKLLEGFPTESQFWEVINLYLTEYGEYKGIEEFYIQYKLLKILRNKEDFIIPEVCNVTLPKEEVKTKITDETF